jgi:hypothetical protein
MIEKIVKRGYHSKHKELVTTIEILVTYGSLDVFYIDTNYNTIKPYHNIKGIISKTEFTKLNFNEGFVSALFSTIDEDAYEKDYICKCLVVTWTGEDGEVITCKAGDGILIDVIDTAWEDVSKLRVCQLPNQTDKFFYIGSGVAVALTYRAIEDESLLLFTEETQFYLNRKSDDGVFDYLNKYKEQISVKDFGKMLDDINYDYMLSKHTPSKDLFMAVIY